MGKMGEAGLQRTLHSSDSAVYLRTRPVARHMARLLSHYRVKKSVGKFLIFGRLIFGNWVLPGEGRGARAIANPT